MKQDNNPEYTANTTRTSSWEKVGSFRLANAITRSYLKWTCISPLEMVTEWRLNGEISKTYNNWKKLRYKLGNTSKNSVVMLMGCQFDAVSVSHAWVGCLGILMTAKHKPYFTVELHGVNWFVQPFPSLSHMHVMMLSFPCREDGLPNSWISLDLHKFIPNWCTNAKSYKMQDAFIVTVQVQWDVVLEQTSWCPVNKSIKYKSKTISRIKCLFKKACV